MMMKPPEKDRRWTTWMIVAGAFATIMLWIACGLWWASEPPTADELLHAHRSAIAHTIAPDEDFLP